MKYSYILFSLCLLIVAGCRNIKTSNGETQPTVDIYSGKFSKGFKIEGYEDNSNIIISVFNPWQGAQGVISRLMLVRDSNISNKFDGNILYGSPERIVCMSSTNVAMLDKLGQIDKVVGVSGINYISNPFIQQNKNEIADVGFEGNMNYEALLSVKPDLVLLYAVNAASSIESKLKENSIPYIYIGDYLEENPLGKAEWIMVLAEILNLRDEGKQIFENITKKYENLKSMVDSANIRRPTFMLNVPYSDSWFMPSNQSYMVSMMRDAGADYIYNKDTGNSSKPINLEEAYQFVSKADFWLNVNNLTSLEELKTVLPKFKDCKPVINGQVYNNNLRSTPGGGNDCFESGIMNPDLILRDLIKIFHPDLIQDEFIYYRQLE